MVDASDGENLSDDEEAQLLGILGKLLGRSGLLYLNDIGQRTNIKVSDLVHVALAATDWEHQAEVMNEVDAADALAEVDDILKADDSPEMA